MAQCTPALGLPQDNGATRSLIFPPMQPCHHRKEFPLRFMNQNKAEAYKKKKLKASETKKQNSIHLSSIAMEVEGNSVKAKHGDIEFKTLPCRAEKNPAAAGAVPHRKNRHPIRGRGTPFTSLGPRLGEMDVFDGGVAPKLEEKNFYPLLLGAGVRGPPGSPPPAD
ncbi:hypothetical protein GWK47_024424 [Chionoecetes opilio]|uniref:Uncharacterized protein n=1 Tax=Chionoecetes opilio TaxID=41210 RepID=A0A8J5CDQ6_CHIOP|nr:hypothetical protein GWK47_024424 [Chionoecetes opilio]